MNMKKKILTLLLTYSMLCCSPITVFAEESTNIEQESKSDFDVKTDIEFKGNVPNDVTGKWRWAKTLKSADVYDYAIDYCKEYCKDDEIHAIINTADNTTTCLNYTVDNGGSVIITVREYVADEEKDAKTLYSGEIIKERVIDISTGFYFDYTTGESGYLEEMQSEQVTQTAISYVLNTNTKKFHKPSCGSVKNMKDSNKKEYSGTRDDVVAMGYEPCGKCKP